MRTKLREVLISSERVLAQRQIPDLVKDLILELVERDFIKEYQNQTNLMARYEIRDRNQKLIATIRRFDPTQLRARSGAVCQIIGKRSLGKSILSLNLMKQMAPHQAQMVIHPTEEYSSNYTSYVDDIFIHDEYKPQLLDALVNRQQMMVKRSNQSASRNGDHPNRAILVLDDCCYDSSHYKSNQLKNIFMNGRHLALDTILVTQYPVCLSPSIRTNIDYIFLAREPKTSLCRKLFEYYAGMFPDFDIFWETLAEVGKNYGFLVIDNTSISNKLEDQVFWYRV